MGPLRLGSDGALSGLRWGSRQGSDTRGSYRPLTGFRRRADEALSGLYWGCAEPLKGFEGMWDVEKDAGASVGFYKANS